jgi:four helix bundle protein
MKENIIKSKSFKFACTILEVSELLESKRKYVLSNQILRSGTSIGANIRESEHAESKADFIHKLSIALKEANETAYWIDLLKSGKYIDDICFKDLNSEIEEILKLLIAIINSLKFGKNKIRS